MTYSFSQHIPGDCSSANISGQGRDVVFSCESDDCDFVGEYCICRFEKSGSSGDVRVYQADERERDSWTEPEDRLSNVERGAGKYIHSQDRRW